MPVLLHRHYIETLRRMPPKEEAVYAAITALTTHLCVSPEARIGSACCRHWIPYPVTRSRQPRSATRLRWLCAGLSR